MMAGKREEWRAVICEDGWWVLLDARNQKVAKRLSESDARQIAREHNLHPRLVYALKEVSGLFGNNKVVDCSCHICTQTRLDQEQVMLEEISDLLAEAEKEGER